MTTAAKKTTRKATGMPKMEQLCDGIEYAVQGNQLILKIEVDPEGRESKSGKTLLTAGTGGNRGITIDGVEHKIGINMFKYKPR